MCSEVENELYRPRVHEKEKQKLLLNGYRNSVTRYIAYLPV
jgi:hypothetical protein